MPARAVGYLSMAVAAASWGSLPVILTRAGGSSSVMVALRMGFGAAALGAFLLLFGRRDLWPSTGKRLMFGLGALLAVNWVLFFAAIQRIGATAVLLNYVFPLVVAVLAPVVLGEPRERPVPYLALLGLIGVGVILAPDFQRGEPGGSFLALGAALTSAALVLGARRVVEHAPGPVVAFWQNATGVLVLIPVVGLTDGAASIPWRWGAFIGVVHTAVAGVLFFRAIGRIPAQEAGVLMYAEPLSAVAFAWAIDGVTPVTTAVVGGGLVVGAGIGVVSLPAPRAPARR